MTHILYWILRWRAFGWYVRHLPRYGIVYEMSAIRNAWALSALEITRDSDTVYQFRTPFGS